MEPHELVKGEKAEKTEKSPTEVHEKAQAKPETVQTSVELLPKNGPEVGPGPPQTPPAAQNEPKPDERFTGLQEKIRETVNFYTRKSSRFGQFCVVGKKSSQIEAEMKKAYGETQQNSSVRSPTAYKRGEGSDQALQELLKDLPIPAKFTKQPTGQVTTPAYRLTKNRSAAYQNRCKHLTKQSTITSRPEFEYKSAFWSR